MASICWSCREAVQGPVCPSCDTLQPPPPEPDYFQILGLPRQYHLDRSRIEQAYRAVSRRVHPDRWAQRKAVLRRMSLQWTASVNTARRVLLDPTQRARYLATGDAKPREVGGSVPQDFLTEIFSWRMEAEDDPAAVHAKAEARRQQLTTKLEAVFSRWEAGEDGLDAVEPLLGQLTYLTNLVRETA